MMFIKIRIFGITLIALAVGMLIILLLPKACLSFVLAGIVLLFGIYLLKQCRR